MTEDELVGWHYQLDGHEFEQASLIVQLVKNLPAMQEIPVSGRSAGEGIGYLPTPVFLDFPCGSAGEKNPPAMQESWV